MTRARAREIAFLNISPSIYVPIITGLLVFAAAWGRAEMVTSQKVDKVEFIQYQSVVSLKNAQQDSILAISLVKQEQLEKALLEASVTFKRMADEFKAIACHGRKNWPECR